MSKKNEGLVLGIEGEYAIVMGTAHVGCDSLYCCQGEGVSNIAVEMLNTINAVKGDNVIFIAKETNMLLAAFIVYMMPLLMVGAGAIIGYTISENYGLNSTIISLVGSGMFFLIAIFLIKKYEYYVSHNRDMKPEIISIVK